MTIPFRVIDTGVREGRWQISLDQALIDLHREGRVPDTVRFLRFEPSALVGRHQAVAHELKLDYCRANGIGIVRRVTGGGAIYLDPGQVGWEIVLSRKRLPMPSLADYTRAICEAAAFGLSKAFAINAHFRPRNDIEVDGKKISGTGGFFDGDTLIYQGTVLVDVDASRMMSCLNVPEAKLKKRDLDKAEARVTTLKALLGGEAPDVMAVQQAILLGFATKLGITPQWSTLSEAETAETKRLYEQEIGTDEFVYSIDDPRGADVFVGSRTGPGGTVSAYLRLEGEGAARRVREALVTGDFFITPPRLVFDLEASLRGVPVAEIGEAVDRFFAARKPEMLSAAPADFRLALEAAAGFAPA
ncbi:MAG: lipoate--protein ligase family protein [Hyphomicrobiaceae bacterium]|nr:MAG: lipoate--protein ligase family protein [Hyphomicrobiaceae bacterium]